MTATTPDHDTARRGWLFGPLPDLLLGCGLAYLAVFAALALAGPSVRGAVPLGALILCTLFTGTPHYGATLLRVYERGEDRRRYQLFAVWASAAIAIVFVAGLHDRDLRALVNSVYLTWSPWHYTGQNYGIALMLLGRRGIQLPRGEKRLVHASFVLSFLLVFLASHGDPTPVSYAPQVETPEGVRFVSLGIPYAWRNGLMAATALGYAAALVASGRALLRRATLRAVAPAALLLLTQALWFAVPALARATGTLQQVEPLSREFAVYGFLWIANGHALQYLWVTAYYAKRSGSEIATQRFYVKSLLAGAAIWGVPALLFAQPLLGPLPYEAGLFLMIGACVNLHHFVLDGAIWKLRDGRIARVLLRSERADVPEPIGPPRRRWLRGALLGTGAACALIGGLADWEWYFGYRPAMRAGDVERVRAAGARLRWAGRESPSLQASLGRLLMQRGEDAAARAALERSLALRPSERAWISLAALHAGAGRQDEALAAYEAALVLEPDSAGALYRSGLLRIRQGERALGRGRIERAQALAPDDAAIRRALERIRANDAAASGR